MLTRSAMQAAAMRSCGCRPARAVPGNAASAGRRAAGLMHRHGRPHGTAAPRTVTCDAAAGGASNDPYSFLGVTPEADTNEVARAVSKMRYANRTNPEVLKKIEMAQSQMFLDSLNRRVTGSVEVPKEIKYADREPLFPWRPKRWDATPQVIMIAGGIQLALAMFAFQSPNMSKLIGCMLLGVAGNVMKQNAIFPPPKEPEWATEEEAARPGQNFMRGALLGLLATGFGMVFTTAPETVMQIANIPLPGILASQPGLLISFKVAGVALANWIMTAFYY